jgi:CRISPR-associated endoribonuclease Cas6
MRFTIQLQANCGSAVIPINYQYPLSAVIYRIIEKADAGFASFLHQQAYGIGNSLKRFKLFCFSDLSVTFAIKGDRMIVQSANVIFSIRFHIVPAAELYIRVLFMQQCIGIGYAQSRADFTIVKVQ